MNKEKKYMVCTRCSTYNHVRYITDALNGFTSQVTNFQVLTVVIDDYSTDGNSEVVRQYINDNFLTPYREEDNDDYHLIYARHKENENCDIVAFLLKYNHYSIKKSKLSYYRAWDVNAKYIAVCEGDDYWTDPHKLQKQIDFLESHPKCHTCLHDTMMHQMIDSNYNNLTKEEEYDRPFLSLRHDRYISAEEMILQLFWPHTSSIVMDREIMQAKPDCFYVHESGDWQLFMYAALAGKVWAMKDIMSVYRRGVEGSYTKRMGGNIQANILHKQHKAEMLRRVMDYYPKRYRSLFREALYKICSELYILTGDSSYLLEFSFMYKKQLKVRQFIRRVKYKLVGILR